MEHAKPITRAIIAIFSLIVATWFSYVCYGAAVENDFTNGAIIFVTILGFPIGFLIGIFISMVAIVAVPIILIILFFSLLGAIIL